MKQRTLWLSENFGDRIAPCGSMLKSASNGFSGAGERGMLE